MELGDQTGIATLVADKIDFKPKIEGIRKVIPSILINRKIHQEDTILIVVYPSNSSNQEAGASRSL